MGWLSALLGLGGKALEKILPDRARLQQQQMEINAETERTSGGRMTPRKLLMYLLAVAAGWELLLRPSMGKELWLAVSAMFGMGF